MNKPVRTTCPYCGVGCGIVATALADGGVAIEGDREHPANFGRLCSKGSALAETLSLEDRLLTPVIGNQQSDWDTALDLVARTFSQVIAEHGPQSVAFYVSGQILTEDYYVANKLMKGFIGAANIDTNSRLCMASSVAGHKRAFGSDTVPGNYEDLELADLIVLVGSNLAWCHPVLYQRIAEARAKRGTRIVLVDPRETASCEIADLHLDLRPGSDVALFNGLLAHLAGANAFDREFVSKHTVGSKQALLEALRTSLAQISRITGLDKAALLEFYDLFVSTERVVTIYSQGVNQSVSGTDKVNSILNCHLVTGRIGRPGMGPFSVTGQPNAMGGREVGGLANMLAGHMEIGNPDHSRIVRDFWRAPKIAADQGLKAVDMFRAVADGRIKAIWIMATNPVVSMPEADGVRAALQACPFVVVSDVVRNTDTTRLAHVLLPSAAWGEKDGTVTNSERRISRQRAFLPIPGEARADWWQICEVGKRMGYAEAFSYEGAWEIFAEHAALSGTQNSGSRDFDISAVADIDANGFESLEPFQWPRQKGSADSTSRLFADGGFFTPDRKARIVAVAQSEPSVQHSPGFPLILNSGRIRDQWHTMTRTAKSARLMSHIGEPMLEIHPSDAAACGLGDAEIAEVESSHGTAVLRVVLTDRQRPGRVFAPMHWTSELSARGRINATIAGRVDPFSGQPDLKLTAVNVRKFDVAWYGFSVLRGQPILDDAGYWAMARTVSGWRLELAGTSLPDDWARYAGKMLALDSGDEILAYQDAASGQYRMAAFRGQRLESLLYVAPTPVAVSRTWAARLLDLAPGEIVNRLACLAGRAGADVPDPGAIVCSCFGVGINQITEAVVARACASVERVGVELRAGTNCGSCRSEISRIIHEASLKKAG
jgi:assimilatory nitrate reductase catalytic subunit